MSPEKVSCRRWSWAGVTGPDEENVRVRTTPSTAMTTTAAATTARLRLVRRDTIGIVCVGVIPPLEVVIVSRYGSISSAVCHRSAGFLARHFMTTASSSPDTWSRYLVTGSACSVTCAARTAWGVAATNGGLPRHAGGGDLAAAGGFAHSLGDAEVGHHRVPAREHHVVRLDVPVHHPFRVGERQRVHHLAHYSHRLRDRQFAFLVDPVPQRLPLDVGHDVIKETVGFSRIEQGQDVGMIEIGGDADFAEKSFGPERRRQVGAQYLHRDLTIVSHVLGQVDGGHAARP